MDPVTRFEAARRLTEAYRSGRPIPPLSESHPLTIEDAYAIQLLCVEALQARGDWVRGYKVGVTNPQNRAQLDADPPHFGHLLTDSIYSENTPIPTEKFIRPRIAPGIAIALRTPLRGPGVTVIQALAAVDYVLPALEVVDCRIDGGLITTADTVADNGSSAALVLGSTPTMIGGLDLRMVGCALFRNGTVAATGAGGATLGSPVNALVWLANTLGKLGFTLEPGQVVLPGAVTPTVKIGPGNTITASFTGLGSVTARFAEEAS